MKNIKKMAEFRRLWVLNSAFVALIFTFSACSLAPSAQPNPSTHALKTNDNIVLNSAKVATKSVKIAPIQSVLYLKSNEIAYIKGNELSAYSKHLWKSSPVNALSVLLASKFEKNKLFKAVLNSNSQIQADLVLELRFDAFEQVFNEGESFVSLELSATLLENKGKKLIGVKHFSYKVPVKQIQPSAAVASFNEALNSLGDDMVLWIHSLL